MTIDLPEPDIHACEHSNALAGIIRAEIQASGTYSIGFDRYMDLALYHPGFGYYRAGAHKFGATGDFVTAPEVSPLFSRCLARQIASILENFKSGGDVLELGAGTGVMAAELLHALSGLGHLPRCYAILELSGELRERQYNTLSTRVPDLLSRVEWLDALPPVHQGVVVANELLDAMPAQCFRILDEGIFERRVGLDSGDYFIWHECPADVRLTRKVTHLLRDLHEPLAAGYLSELNPQLEAWLKGLSNSIAQAVVLLIDYGYPRREYYHPQRSQGTLICHFQHRAHVDPFYYPGLQDISTNVDFTAVAEAAEAGGMDMLGYTTQANFLLANGLEEIYGQVSDERQRLLYSQQIKRLTLPSEMGERFQVMALGKNYSHRLESFSIRDLSMRL